MELQELKPTPDTNDEAKVEVCPGNGTCSNHSPPNSTEDSCLLENTQAERNGAHSTVIIPDHHDESEGTLGRLKRELNEPACWKLKVWMLILIIFIVLVLVIFLSLYFCSVYKEDVDDKYNVAEFVVPRNFSGNFTLLKNITLDSQSSLQQKLTHIYTSSFALGRYFSLARVKLKRNSNSSAEYELEFKIPKEHEQLIQYTLSKEMVYSVLLQQLYDQDTGDPLYIEPSSLTMEVGS